MLVIFILVLIAIYLIFKGFDVRFILLSTAIIIAGMHGAVFEIFDRFLSVMGDEKIIGPICTGMGFAYVIKKTGADLEMVKALLNPIRKLKWALPPAGLLIGYITNTAITSQTAAAAAVGPVLIPLMVAAGWRPITAGLTLLLGVSLGGNLLNPGEADIVAIQNSLKVEFSQILDFIILPSFFSLLLMGIVFCFLIWRREPEAETHFEFLPPITPSTKQNSIFHTIKVFLPMLPLSMMLALQPRFHLVPALEKHYPAGPPVSHVMLFCLFLTIAIHVKQLNEITRSFFEGIGQGFIQVITLIVTASCFIKSLEIAGVIESALHLVRDQGFGAIFFSASVPAGLALISGSGTAASVSFSNAILPHFAVGNISGGDFEAGLKLGTLAAITSSIGRTLSPAAAVVVFTSALIRVSPLVLVRKAAPTMVVTLLGVVGFYFFK